VRERSGLLILSIWVFELSSLVFIISLLLNSYMRKLSQWPTYPQLYISGKFVGGLDVAKELDNEGALVELTKEK
jgi:glutaredoxin-related protein